VDSHTRGDYAKEKAELDHGMVLLVAAYPYTGSDAGCERT
jgi:hypothetical protein